MDDTSLTQVDVYPKSHAFAIHPRVFLVEHLDGILQDTGNPLAIAAKVAIHVTVVLLLVLIVAFVLILVAFVLAIMPVMLSLLTICIHLIHLSAFLVFVFILLEGFVTSFSHLLIVILFLLVILNSRDLYGLLVPGSKLLSSKRLVYVSFHANDVEDPRGPFRIQRLTAQHLGTSRRSIRSPRVGSCLNLPARQQLQAPDHCTRNLRRFAALEIQACQDGHERVPENLELLLGTERNGMACPRLLGRWGSCIASSRIIQSCESWGGFLLGRGVARRLLFLLALRSIRCTKQPCDDR
mmetsp:Transcript_82740/g.198556  ORF Transcript_82740/g.198556 Transcript_82740/m.198556 type:complete len:296 (-) Transcript_82740:269-1156(-)